MNKAEYIGGIIGAFIIGVLLNSFYMDAKKQKPIKQEAYKMFYIKKAFKFDAAHWLPNYKGKCANMHGHTWHGKVCLQAQAVNFGSGMVLDFKILKAEVDTVIERVDHKIINDSIPMENPTAELIAQWIFGELKMAINTKYSYEGVSVQSVSIEETDGSEAIYHE